MLRYRNALLFEGFIMDLAYHILIVDDIVDNIQIAMNILKEENYDFSYATSGEEALELLRNTHFDLVLLDIMMPEMDGYTVCEKIKSTERLKDIPVIFLTAKSDIDSITKGFKTGGVDYIVKPFHPEELIARVRTHLELYHAKNILRHHNITLKTKIEEKEIRLAKEIEEGQIELIFTLTELMEHTSDETGKHIKRVAEYAKLLAHYHPTLSLHDEKLIYHASPMHDIGKIMIPQELLHKSEKLTESEFEKMKEHTTKAHRLLQYSSRQLIHAAGIIAHEHHEKWDGSGYPRGLKGEEIHIYGRIVAIADVFDALTHKRSYKDAWPAEKAAAYIIEQSGIHFDPKLVEIFKAHLDEFITISKL
jgi:putative two-component system response regulator